MRIILAALISLAVAQPLRGSLLRRKTTINVDPWTEDSGVDRLEGDGEKTFWSFIITDESSMSMGMPDISEQPGDGPGEPDKPDGDGGKPDKPDGPQVPGEGPGEPEKPDGVEAFPAFPEGPDAPKGPETKFPR